jgi:hypothetical protein
MELKVDYAYVYISKSGSKQKKSEDSSDEESNKKQEKSTPLFYIGIMPYSVKEGTEEYKSFLLSFNYTSPDGYKSLSGNVEALKEHEKTKILFGVPSGSDEKAPEDSLGGKGGTRFTNKEGKLVFGYIFSVAGGQKALQWFADKSMENMPPQDEVVLPKYMEKASKSEKALYRRQFSQHDYEELSLLLGVKEKKTASKYQAPPKIVKGVPIDLEKAKATLPSKIAGIPTGRKGAKKEETSLEETYSEQNEGNNKVQEAINTIFKAILSGDITEETEFAYTHEDKKGKIEGPDKKGKLHSRVYQGFVGVRNTVRANVKDIMDNNLEEEYETAIIEPTLVFKLVARLEVPKD